MKRINSIFDNLDTWRNLPAYQLERRADVFFSIYLSDILSHKFGVEIEGVIPEFPIRVGTIHHKKEINKSFKVDYFVKVRDSKTLFFIELKTDDNSRRNKQDWYLEKAKQVGMVKLLEGIHKIYKATFSKKKYEYLLRLLQDMKLINLNNGNFEISKYDYEIQIIYIQPNNPDGQKNVITFIEIARLIENYGDELSLRFSKSLINWASTKAGEYEITI